MRAILIVCALIAVFAMTLGFLVSFYAQRTSRYLIDPGGDMMEKIYKYLDMDYSDQQILNKFSASEKKMLKEFQINWSNDLLPVKTKQGELISSFLPIWHVAVSGKPVAHCGKNIGTYQGFYGPRGLVVIWHDSTLPFGHLRKDGEDLDKLINTTKYGVNNILKGDVSDIRTLTDLKMYDIGLLKMYLALKKLIDKDKGFITNLTDLAAMKNPCVNKWIKSILEKAVINPELPSLDPYDEEIFYRNLSKWFDENEERISLSSDFLFRKEEQ